MTSPQASLVHALRESWFWSGVLRDHAEFILTNLAPEQDRAIRWATGFLHTFEELRAQAIETARTTGISGPAGSGALTGVPAETPLAHLAGHELAAYEQQVKRLLQAGLEATAAIRGFKELMLQQKLDCTVKLGLSPTLLAHMITEAEEAYRVLSGARETAPLPPALEALHHHLIWLPDAAGHAAVVHDGMDGVEQGLRSVAQNFQQIFDGMQIKARELYTMLRVAPRMVGALRRLNRDSVAQIDMFRAFLTELREHLEGCEILVSQLMPLLADHMVREEMYYMEKVLTLPKER